MDEATTPRRRRWLPRRIRPATGPVNPCAGFATTLGDGSAVVARQEAELAQRWQRIAGPEVRVIVCDDMA